MVGDQGVWRVPLQEKAMFFERNLLKNHWIRGLYPSIVEIPLDGGPVDQSTTGYSNVAHSVCWTANYLAGQAYRFAFTGDEKVRKHAGKVLGAMIRCLEITGVPGLQARGYVLGHGESYEEREGSGKSNHWHQGAGKHSNLRWRGDPSHHNYSDAIHGYAAYYDLAADEKQKGRIRGAVRDLVGYWAFNGGFLRRLDGSVATHILGITDGRTPNLRTVMAAAGLKAAHHITGEGAFGSEYEKLVEQYRFREWEEFPEKMRVRQGHDDAEHVFGHLDNLFRQENDPELLGFYGKVLDALWRNHGDDRQSLFNYIYVSLRPKCPDRDDALRQALWTLRTWPTDRLFRPRMNSLRSDIRIIDGMSEEPLPMYESPWDNEYQWKGSLYRLDGCLSRCIVSLAVPREDPMVVWAVDERGDVYRSLDGARTWRRAARSLGRPAGFISAGHRIRMLFAGCGDGFYGSMTAGSSWFRMPVPPEAGRPVDLRVDSSNPNVVYAIGEGAVYRSLDHGERWLGRRWECLTEGLPPSEERSFAVSAGANPRLYANLDGTFYSSVGDGRWRRGGFAGIPEYGQPLRQIAIGRSDPDTIYAALGVSYERYAFNIVFRSEDRGATWNNDLPRLYSRYIAGYERGGNLLEGELQGELHGLAVTAEEQLLAATSKGIMRSEDGGESWLRSGAGLGIPVARSVFCPGSTRLAYAGTPGGLHHSEDGGRSWRSSNLILTFREKIRREVGSAGYLDAYWMGRYHGFISEKEATEDPQTWNMEI
jgi:photosystem II stability/assembly factor-like uncharacterized protein